jgi:hypothetical protein
MAAQFEHILYNRQEDPQESTNRIDGSYESDAVELLRHALVRVEAPSDHLVRLGLD